MKGVKKGRRIPQRVMLDCNCESGTVKYVANQGLATGGIYSIVVVLWSLSVHMKPGQGCKDI